MDLETIAHRIQITYLIRLACLHSAKVTRTDVICFEQSEERVLIFLPRYTHAIPEFSCNYKPLS